MNDDSRRSSIEPRSARGAGASEGLRAAALRWHGDELIVISYRLAEPDRQNALTAAERAVTRLALEGLSNREMAVRRRASERTIANQLASVFRKLNLGSRRELAALTFTGTKR